MQIKQSQRAVGFGFPPIHDHDKLLNIKLGTSVHLRTCVVWLITPVRNSSHRRRWVLWRSFQLYPFLLPGPSSTPRIRSVLRRHLSSTSFWRSWGSESWRTRRSMPSGRSKSLFSASCRQCVRRRCLLTPTARGHSDLSEEQLGKPHQFEGLLTG